MKEYIKKDGTVSKYEYSKEQQREYNKRRNKEIYNLQKLKYYYKKNGNLEKVKTIDILINIEKRKEETKAKENENG